MIPSFRRRRRLTVLIAFACCLAGVLPSAIAGQLAPVPAASPASESGTADGAPLIGEEAATSESVADSSPHYFVLGIYCALIIAASMMGGALPFVIELTHTRMQTMISFVGGLMLGIGFFHLMPHAVHELHSAQTTAQWMMVGIVMMFVLLRLFHFHNHEPVHLESDSNSVPCDHDHGHDDHHHDHSQSTGETHSPADCHSHGHSHGISWAGIAFGLSVHTLIDGLALGASVHGSVSGATVPFVGLGTFLAVLLHKPLDAVSITSLMVAGGRSRRSVQLINFGFALMCPLGAALFLLGAQQFSGIQQEILGTALAFSAGVFICISLSDLLPEMEFHSHNKVRLTIALGLGIALSWGLTFLERGHLH